METGTALFVRNLVRPAREEHAATNFGMLTFERHTSGVLNAPAMASEAASDDRAEEADRATGVKFVGEEYVARDLDVVTNERVAIGVIKPPAMACQAAANGRAEEANCAAGMK